MQKEPCCKKFDDQRRKHDRPEGKIVIVEGFPAEKSMCKFGRQDCIPTDSDCYCRCFPFVFYATMNGIFIHCKFFDTCIAVLCMITLLSILILDDSCCHFGVDFCMRSDFKCTFPILSMLWGQRVFCVLARKFVENNATILDLETRLCALHEIICKHCFLAMGCREWYGGWQLVLRVQLTFF